MKIKKYVAPTMPEVMKEVRKDLGADAVILNSKVVQKGGFLGLFKKKNIEVIAALDPEPARNELSRSQQIEQQVVIDKKEFNHTEKVLDEVRDLKNWMIQRTSIFPNSYPKAYLELYESLINKELSPLVAKNLIDALADELGQDERTIKDKDIRLSFKKILESKLEELEFGGIDYEKKVVHLVGPTGVGKTTTIAKLAAKSVLQDHKKVALITTDTYRIAAIDQLKTYSKILNIPLEVVYSIEDYHKAIEKFNDYDLILVDTAGRNFKDKAYVKQLSQTVDLYKDIDTYLVLSLTTKSKDLEEIVEQFKHIPIKQFIFSKKDETSTFGTVLNLCFTYHKGIAYFTNGQDVPDDICEASITNICELIVGEQ